MQVTVRLSRQCLRTALRTSLCLKFVDFLLFQRPVKHRDFIQSSFEVGVIVAAAAEETFMRGLEKITLSFEFERAIEVGAHLVLVANKNHVLPLPARDFGFACDDVFFI